MAVSPLARKYEALTLRERALVALAVIGGAIYLWNDLAMGALLQTRAALTSELASAGDSGFIASSTDLSDPRQVNLKRAAELQTHLRSLDAHLSSSTAGFIPADRMVEVLNDVLDRQGRLELVSIRNMEVMSVVKMRKETAAREAALNGTAAAASTASATTDTAADQPADAADPAADKGPGLPPYVHPIEIVIDGQYADILEYLAALEKLPYKFHWSTLELVTTGYPRNRVRIVLATFSLDSTWLGV